MSDISDAGAFRNSAIVAGILFIAATSATMVSQIIIGPIIAEPDVVASVSASRSAFALGVVLELVNSLASAGIAIAMFPLLRRCFEGVAVGYVGFRVIERGWASLRRSASFRCSPLARAVLRPARRGLKT